ncbi:hypothetical protein BEI59_01295 [Eisenbergiella tayi]|uniref:Uncharacterized protein n=1 Tax=Eisenbergiella tayi TaxID=1432052 RepID=A0A1E3UP99_9FIRM|nr:hypothetical protein BEI63_31280 [Eisenbergiella tayi]ODR55822.1 hypothetical protein BEI59_01295 [Eisenbergiella tayi]ODR58888.1 hypothetical protein BEI64_13390 [Eisenbergiella tayi]
MTHTIFSFTCSSGYKKNLWNSVKILSHRCKLHLLPSKRPGYPWILSGLKYIRRQKTQPAQFVL